MSSVTEPLPPQSKARAVTHRLLEAMVERPPGRGLIIQTHTSYAASPEIVEVLRELSRKTSVLVSISVETNRQRILGLKTSCCSIRKRLQAFETLSSQGIATQASVSPLMPCDPEVFARQLRDRGVWRVILDHWEIGDGSRGSRTESVGVPDLLTSHGYDPKWCSAAILDELQPIFAAEGFRGGVGRKPDYFAYIPEQSRLRRYLGEVN
jgi:DNA repair photolyase